MSDSTSERQLPANGFVPSPFWADPVPATVPEATAAAASDGSDLPRDIASALARGDEAALTGALRDLLANLPPVPAPAPATAPDALGLNTDSDSDPGIEPGIDPGIEPGADAQASVESEETEVLDGVDAQDGEPGEDADAEPDEDEDEEDDEAEQAAARQTRFDELVEERVRRAHYAHHLTRAVFTPGESATAVIVEKRAAVWVPTLTFVATLVSAVAAVVLATRLHGDPADPTGHQLLIVMITVCLLAAAFGILLRAEVHYERLRPRGRTVRHDVADAYEIVRDAPRRLIRIDAPLEVLRGVSDLLPAAEQMVDALVEYAAEGGSRVREHPAYERILRMRAEVEAIEVILAERAERDLQAALGRKPRTSDARLVGTDGTPLPRPEQVADYAGLANLAASIDGD